MMCIILVRNSNMTQVYMCINLCTDMNKTRQSSLQHAKSHEYYLQSLIVPRGCADQIYIFTESSQLIAAYLHDNCSLTLSYSPEGSPALAVFRPHYL